MENIEKGRKISLIDLPESILDCILKRLSPVELCKMSEVCTSLTNRCQNDLFWEEHVKHKWGRVFGDVAYKEWQWHITAAREGVNLLNHSGNQNGSLGSFTGAWPNLYLGSYLEDCSHLINGPQSNKFMMTLYISLECGKFWFPAQVYKGLTIHNALVSYNSKSDTSQARHPNGGWRILRNNIRWDMVRARPVETPSPYVLHVSDCLDNLKSGDHIEIQWRGSAQAPYDWWYAAIGHLESCNENEYYCHCHYNENVIVEFKQYPQGSSMRRITLSRKNYGEQGNGVGGVDGGIRKLQNEEEIETWKKLSSSQDQSMKCLQCYQRCNYPGDFEVNFPISDFNMAAKCFCREGNCFRYLCKARYNRCAERTKKISHEGYNLMFHPKNGTFDVTS